MPPSPPRRSSRLRKSQSLSTSDPAIKRRRIADASPAVCADELPPSPRRSCRSTPLDLAQRENALVKRERDLQCKSDDLDHRLSRLADREELARLLISQAALREAKSTLLQLEDHFTCPLCYDIMACPISLNPGQCGHTFCALCILKWFFSRLHKACGGWHESVDCPICRSLLIITPDHSPRLDITFPFTPNRTVDALVRDLIGKLADSPSSDDITAGGTTGAKKTEDTMAEWRTGGTTRTEWFRRDSTGREEINAITKNWKNLTPKDFVDLKAKLGV